ncbi:MAG: hypothetical protein IJU50_01620 [Lachnospiraceae bacterium]|nr:hypothetical protein [Lachnospiraceae bacterium]
MLPELLPGGRACPVWLAGPGVFGMRGVSRHSGSDLRVWMAVDVSDYHSGQGKRLACGV